MSTLSILLHAHSGHGDQEDEPGHQHEQDDLADRRLRRVLRRLASAAAPAGPAGRSRCGGRRRRRADGVERRGRWPVDLRQHPGGLGVVGAADAESAGSRRTACRRRASRSRGPLRTRRFSRCQAWRRRYRAAHGALGRSPPSFGRVSLSLLAGQTHVNLLGNVHGGEVMRLVDSTAGAVAQRHSGGPAVTAAMDEMAFLAPVHVGDILRAAAQVNWAGRTSMEVGVRVESEPWNQAGDRAGARRLGVPRLRGHRRGRQAPGDPRPRPRDPRGGTPDARGRDPPRPPARRKAEIEEGRS